MPVQLHPLEHPLPDGDPDIVVLSIGEPGAMGLEELNLAIDAFEKAAQIYQNATFLLVCGCYDADPRPIWEIPEAAARFNLFAAACFSGGHDPLIHRLQPESIALLCQCGAWGTDHPFKVTITNDRPPLQPRKPS